MDTHDQNQETVCELDPMSLIQGEIQINAKKKYSIKISRA